MIFPSKLASATVLVLLDSFFIYTDINQEQYVHKMLSCYMNNSVISTILILDVLLSQHIIHFLLTYVCELANRLGVS